VIKVKNHRRPLTGIGLAAASIVAAAGGVLTLAHARKKHNQDENAPKNKHRIGILGAGFAGLTAAEKLSSRVTAEATITLVDQHNYHLFTPMLYQVATLGTDPYTVAFPVRQFSGDHNVTFRKDTVTGIDLDAKRVQLEEGTLEFDYLVIALGTTTDFFDNQSAQEHAFPLKWLEEGISIRNHLLDTLEQASVTQDKEQRSALLTFVVVGGGATGVETAAALSTMLDSVFLSDYPHLNPSEAKVILIESEGKLLGHMGGNMARVALKRLRDSGVDVWLNTKAKDIEPGRVSCEDGRAVEAKTIIWSTGVRVPELVSSLRAEHGKGGSLVVDEYLQVCGKPGIYAAGDCAHFEDPATGKSVPLLAAAAVQEGAAVARNIDLAIHDKPQKPFRYRDMGNMVALGEFSGAAEVKGVTVGGLAGWLAWRMVHLAKITSFRSKLAALVDWTMGYFYTPDTARPAVEPIRSLAGSSRATPGKHG